MSTETQVQTVTLDVGGMHCEHCAAAIEMRLRATPGVTAVKVNYPAATADVTFDPGQTDVGLLIAAVEDEGYEATVGEPAVPQE